MVLDAVWEAAVAGNALVAAVDFQRALHELDVHLAPDVFVRHGIVVLMDGDVAVRVHLAVVEPFGDLIRDVRQFIQERLFLQPCLTPAARALLERRTVERVHCLADGGFQRREVEERLVAQLGDDRRRDLADRAFHGGFFLRLPHGCGENGRDVM